MITHSNRFFDATVLGQTGSLLAPYSVPAKTAPKSKVSKAPEMSASLWRHTLNESEAGRRHGLVVRIVFGVLSVMSVGSVAAAAWQLRALMSDHGLHDAISAFLH